MKQIVILTGAAFFIALGLHQLGDSEERKMYRTYAGAHELYRADDFSSSYDMSSEIALGESQYLAGNAAYRLGETFTGSEQEALWLRAIEHYQQAMSQNDHEHITQNRDFVAQKLRGLQKEQEPEEDQDQQEDAPSDEQRGETLETSQGDEAQELTAVQAQQIEEYVEDLEQAQQAYQRSLNRFGNEQENTGLKRLEEALFGDEDRGKDW